MRGRTTIVATQVEDGEAISAFLLVVGRDAYATYNLPASGTLTIGRGESNAVRIDDPLASRAHACLHVGDEMLFEDLGSVNGTRIKDQPIKQGTGSPSTSATRFRSDPPC
jgi:two-component system, NtrC family, response regulator AtoC